MTLHLLESIAHNNIINTLRGKKGYAISEINFFFLKGQDFYPSNNKKEGKYFYVFKVSKSTMKINNMVFNVYIKPEIYFDYGFPLSSALYLHNVLVLFLLALYKN